MALENVSFGEEAACLHLKLTTHKRWTHSRSSGLHMPCTLCCQPSERRPE